ncbi:hypothetical protein P12x_003643 [Tundrisphaera lichenicola]|uniref:hypothetical protein n=1 Tax=Tundrisphaera lichenicola TaxID=2029860 RepID=UPI003EB80E4F
MKISKQVGIILGGLTLTLMGCESAKEPTAEPAAHEEAPSSPTSISTPEPPVEPSPIPAMPSPNATEAEPKAEEPGKAESPK